jgi:hypothetical protein
MAHYGEIHAVKLILRAGSGLRGFERRDGQAEEACDSDVCSGEAANRSNVRMTDR